MRSIPLWPPLQFLPLGFCPLGPASLVTDYKLCSEITHFLLNLRLALAFIRAGGKQSTTKIVSRERNVADHAVFWEE